MSRIWSYTAASTTASSGTYTTVQPHQVVLKGVNWGVGSSMPSTSTFQVAANGVTVLRDAVSDRRSGYIENGNGIVAGCSALEFKFSDSASGGAVATWFAWGEYK